MLLANSPHLRHNLPVFGFFFKKFAWHPDKEPARAAWLNLRIRWITEGALIPGEQPARAAIVAGQLTATDFELIPSMFRLEFSKPAHLKEHFLEFCSWADARFESIFLMLREVGAPAIPVLRRIATGEYDWQQGMALDVLGELASRGVETEVVARMVATELKFWRYETILRGIYGISRLASCNEEVADSLLALAAEWGSHDPLEELHILEPLSHFAPRVASRREDQLYDMIRRTGRGVPRSPLAEGFVVNESGVAVGEVPEVCGLTADFHAIRAALALHRIYPDQPEVLAQLCEWRDQHAGDDVREQLAALIPRRAQ